MKLFPWQSADWKRVTSAGRGLHHGLVLAGPAGIGKREFAVALARWMLCANEGEVACGDCQDCRLFDAGTHPDFHVLLTEAEAETGRMNLLTEYARRYPDGEPRGQRKNLSRVIPVDKVRVLIDRFYQSSHTAAGKVALLLPADRMNVNAANSLLKLLEEPPPGSHFLLVTHQPDVLLPTIRSRCVVESLDAPDAETARTWLRERLGDALPAELPQAGPLDIVADQASGALEERAAGVEAVRQLLGGRADPVSLAASLAGQDALSLLGWLQELTAGLIRWQLAGGEPPWAAPGGPGARNIAAPALFAVYDKIGQYRRIARDQLNLQLALEEIFIAMGEAAGSRR